MPRDDTTFGEPRESHDVLTAPALEDHPEHHKLQRIERLADWLDTRFRVPVINFPVGFDGIIGLIPGVGDTITTGLSGYLMYEAYNAGASRGTLAKMGKNVALDWVFGLVPVVGDILDFGYKANARNARLLASELRAKHGRELADKTPRRFRPAYARA